MKNRTYRLCYILLAAAPLMVTWMLLGGLPDTVPLHYGLDGAVDRMGSKYEMLGLPIMLVVFAAGIYLAFWLFRSNEKYRQNQKALNIAAILFAAIFNVLDYCLLFLALRGMDNIRGFDFLKVTAVAMSVMLIFLGNILPKCKQNYLIGIRTKWTLESEEVWYRTHRFGGKAWVIGGAVSALLCAFVLNGTAAMIGMLAVMLALAAISVVYSYRVYKEIGEKTDRQ